MLGLESGYGARRQRSVTEAYRHNPYIGAMQYHCRGLRHPKTNKLLPTKEKTNAYVGTFRHAPETQGLKDILWEDDHWRTPVVSQLQLARQSVLGKQHLGLTALKLIPIGLFQAQESTHDRPLCVICLEDFKDGDELRHLACDHCFHRSCIDIWLLGTLADDETNTNSCPICKQCAHPGDVSHEAHADAGDSQEAAYDEDDDDYAENCMIPASVFQMVGEALHASDVSRAPGPLVTALPIRQPLRPSPKPATTMLAPLLARLLPLQEGLWQQ